MISYRHWFPALFLILGIGLTSVSVTGAQDDHPMFVMVSPAGPDIPFFRLITDGMEDACTVLEVECHWLSDPSFISLESMADYWDKALAMNPDGIGTIVVDPDIIRSGVEQAAELGIPIIAFNLGDPDAGTDPTLPTWFYVGPDMFGSGVSNARRVLAEAAADGAAVQGGVCTNQQLDMPAFAAYCNGVRSVFDEAGIPFEQLPITDDPDVAAREIGAYLEEHQEVNAVLVSGPGAALALHDYMRQAGLEPGDLYAAGRDTVPEVLKMIEDGYLVQTIGQQPYMQGFQTIMSLYLASKYGMRPSSNIYTNIVVDQDNLDQATAQVARGYW